MHFPQRFLLAWGITGCYAQKIVVILNKTDKSKMLGNIQM